MPKAAPKGVLEGDTARAVRSLLRNQSLIPIAVEPINVSGADGATGKGLNLVLFSSRIYNATNLAIWTRQVAGLVLPACL